MAAGLAVRVIYVLATKDYALQGDQFEYNEIGRAAADGNWFWTPFPYGELHESVARPPGYMAWLGISYTVLGVSVTKALLLQSLIGPFVIFMVWLLGRRLFDARVAVLAGTFAAFYPNMWQWETRLYSESLALPLGALLLLIVLERPVTKRVAVAAGATMGVSMLVRPTQVFFFALILAAFWIGTGFKRGVALTALSVGVAALLILPWTIRNYEASDHFVPLSVQDAAVGGTFNQTAADDPVYPYAWRPTNPRDADITGFGAKRRLPDAELRDELQSRAFDFIKDNPDSVPKAFFWNGLTRTWDIRRPARILDEVKFEGRDRGVAKIGMVLYWVLLAGALTALWLQRRRRALVVPVLVGAAAMSVVFTVAAGTRYRLPFEPILVVLACSAFVALWDKVRAGRSAPTPAVGAGPA
jgi:4-amino-4-deoxy-L-arabinose transferase-like glycosyltransferase